MDGTVSIKRIKQLARLYPDSKLADVLRGLPDEVPRMQLPGLVEVWTAVIDSEVKN